MNNLVYEIGKNLRVWVGSDVIYDEMTVEILDDNYNHYLFGVIGDEKYVTVESNGKVIKVPYDVFRKELITFIDKMDNTINA